MTGRLKASSANAPASKPMGAKSPRRYVAIHFPKLPSDRVFRLRYGNHWRQNVPSEKNLPLVFTEKLNNAFRLIHMDEKAENIGLSTGMSLTDAKAAYPQIEVLETDTQKDALLLEAIADWCDRYTPLIAIDKSLPASNQYGLTLDITGCAHLFGGERALLQDLLGRLFHQGFSATGSIAPTPGAAWALSRFLPSSSSLDLDETDHNGTEPVLCSENLERILLPLPLAALRLSADCVNALARLGLRTIGQLKLRPRGPIARRFGREPLLRLDQAFGSVDESISPRRLVPQLMAERHFAEPLVLESAIEEATLRLATHFTEQLEKRGEGVRQAVLALYRVDGKTFRLTTGTSRPERDPNILVRLFKERFTALADEFDAGYGFETIRLYALSCEHFEQEDVSFIAGGTHNAVQSAQNLIDRLAARLGPDNILYGKAENSHLPEMAETLHPVHDCSSSSSKKAIINAENIALNELIRPLRLFSSPEQIEAIAEVPDGPPIRFRWRKVLHKVIRVEGPERISDHWWGKQTPRQTRDYFRIEDQQGHRYWLFREGLYERETNQPKWFLHGLFA